MNVSLPSSLYLGIVQRFRQYPLRFLKAFRHVRYHFSPFGQSQRIHFVRPDCALSKSIRHYVTDPCRMRPPFLTRRIPH